ncbi:MAG TPA: hypothetical protein VF432_27650 [Thermoanaerobaculia bacterium]
MSTIQKSTLDPAETDPKAELPPEEFVLQLREMLARLPKPAVATAPAALRRRLAHVDPNFVQASINAAGSTPEVQSVLGLTEAEMRQETDLSNRWTAVADMARTLLKEILAANTVRRQRIGLAALQTYAICRQLARDDRHATRLTAHLAEMKRLNKFGRARRRPAESEPEPLPQQKQ